MKKSCWERSCKRSKRENKDLLLLLQNYNVSSSSFDDFMQQKKKEMIND
jgi:hypothetical protein